MAWANEELGSKEKGRNITRGVMEKERMSKKIRQRAPLVDCTLIDYWAFSSHAGVRSKVSGMNRAIGS